METIILGIGYGEGISTGWGEGLTQEENWAFISTELV